MATTKTTPAKKAPVAKKAPAKAAVKKAAPKPSTAVSKALNDLQKAQARIDEISKELTELRAVRAKSLLVARKAAVPYSELSERMGGLPTGNIFAMVKAAES